ncbi:hypothetical protein OH491_14400 [Termitidicoccus mucosus]|uniref:hypothetical protein n=1 Tax=Termitidicoccus mucosus TaxID=1184151 RepID=UPI0011AB89F8
MSTKVHPPERDNLPGFPERRHFLLSLPENSRVSPPSMMTVATSDCGFIALPGYAYHILGFPRVPGLAGFSSAGSPSAAAIFMAKHAHAINVNRQLFIFEFGMEIWNIVESNHSIRLYELPPDGRQ